MRNVANVGDCYGCGVCAASCPRNIISIHLNKDGFYEPYINDEDKCLDCGFCLDVCAYNFEDLSLGSEEKRIKSWAAWSNDEAVRKKCSSGGVGFELGKQLIDKGYKAIGCRYDIKEQRAEHFIATTVEEFVQSIGSKYLQSYTEEAFRQIKRNDQKYLVTGTPCQIDSFRRMVRKFRCEDNFVLMDFFCHCVPSMLAWRAYIRMLEPKIGRLTYVSWRNKYNFGWHDSWLMGIDGTKTSEPVNWDEGYDKIIEEKKTYVQSRMSQGDLFYRLFLGDLCMGPQCEKRCKYKYDKSSADIRIGDLWGDTYKDNQEGVSALIAFTQKGQSIINELKNVTLVEHPFDVVAEGQMKVPPHAKSMKPVIMWLLRNNYSLNSGLFRIALFFQRGISKIAQMI